LEDLLWEGASFYSSRWEGDIGVIRRQGKGVEAVGG